MRILSTQYTLKTKSFEIYISGCRGVNGRHCKNCHNPESWDFSAGDIVTVDYVDKILNKIRDFDRIINSIWILGGEPLDNDLTELDNLAAKLRILNKPLWLFTRYSLQEVRGMIDETLFDYIKCGEYIPELLTDDNIQYGVQLATSNQHIYRLGLDY